MRVIFREDLDRIYNHIPNQQCAAEDCVKTTKNNKDYCLKHIDRMNYAQSIANEINRRNHEMISLEQEQELPPDAHLVREANSILWEHQCITAPGLTRHISLNHHQAKSLLRSLERHGYASLEKNQRGILTAISTIDPDSPPV